MFSGQWTTFQLYVDSELTGQALQDYLDANEDRYELICLKHEYPESSGTPKEVYYGDLDKFQEWIAKGLKIPEVKDEEGKVLQVESVAVKKPWTNTHPAEDRIVALEKRIEVLEKK